MVVEYYTCLAIERAEESGCSIPDAAKQIVSENNLLECYVDDICEAAGIAVECQQEVA